MLKLIDHTLRKHMYHFLAGVPVIGFTLGVFFGVASIDMPGVRKSFRDHQVDHAVEMILDRCKEKQL